MYRLTSFQFFQVQKVEKFLSTGTHKNKGGKYTLSRSVTAGKRIEAAATLLEARIVSKEQRTASFTELGLL